MKKLSNFVGSAMLLILAGCGASPSESVVVSTGSDGATYEESTHVPVIISEPLIELEYGKPFSYEIVAENEPLGFAVTNHPAWLKRKGAILSGYPSQAGTFTLELRAFNRYGGSSVFHLQMIVDAQPDVH